MKRIFNIILFACIIFLCIFSSSFAELSINIEGNSIDFGTMAPSDWKEIASVQYQNLFFNKIVVVSDINNAWQLKIKLSSPLTNTSYPAVTIPNENFKWMSTYAESGGKSLSGAGDTGLNHRPADGYVNFSLIDELVYTSGKASTVNDNSNLPQGTEIQFKYAIAMPDNQIAGTYNATVVYTVTQ